jgi:hypothetical protein
MRYFLTIRTVVYDFFSKVPLKLAFISVLGDGTLHSSCASGMAFQPIVAASTVRHLREQLRD